MSPLFSGDEKFDDRIEKILLVIAEFTHSLAKIHLEVCNYYDSPGEPRTTTSGVYKTKTELREIEDNKAKEAAKTFKAALQTAKWGQLMLKVYKCVTCWLEKMDTIFSGKKCSQSTADRVSPIPCKLAAIMFLCGDYYKACNLLKSCLYVVPTNGVARSLLLRWSVFLGETATLEKRYEYEAKIEKHYKETGAHKERLVRLVKTCKDYGNFYRSKNAEKPMEDLLAEKAEFEAKKEGTFAAVEHESLLYYILSHFSKVSNVCENTVDSLYCLQQRYCKCDTLLKNRLRGISHDNQRLDISVIMEDPISCLEAFAAFAEYSDSIRDLAVESYNLGFTREAQLYAEAALKVAMKIGSFPKVMQMANLSALASTEINTDSATVSLEVLKSRIFTLSSSAKIDRAANCSSPGRQVLQKLQASFEELRLTESIQPLKRLHDFRKDCDCELCQFYIINKEFAMDFHLSVIIYHDFADLFVHQMNGRYGEIRNDINVEQCDLVGKKHKMKPPIWMCEVYSLAAVRWLRLCESQGREYLRDTKKADLRRAVLEQVIKFKPYDPYRQLYYSLACEQTKRHDAVGDTSILPYFWMKPSENIAEHSAENEITSSTVLSPKIEAAVIEALKEYSHYSHILYRNWRFPLCTFNARFCKDPWTAATMWAESTVLSTRASARQVFGKLQHLVFQRTSSFESLVKQLPRDFTVIQLAVDDDGNLFLIKLYCERAPIIIPIAHISKTKRVQKGMINIIRENDSSMLVSKEETTPTLFWAKRREVDAKLKNLVHNIQGYVFRNFSAFLLPSHSLAPRGKEYAAALVNKVFTDGCSFDLNMAEELVSICYQVDYDTWKKLILDVGSFCRLPNEKIGLLQKEYPDLSRKLKSKGVLNKEPISYTFLAVCPILSSCPLEALEVFSNHPHVGRIVSIHSLFRQVIRNRSHPREVNVCNSFYVLDPDNNLVATQKRMKDFLQNFEMEGIVGASPSSTELKNILEERDILFFMGHGSGSRYMPKKIIKESKCKAVSVLMGCSSVALDYDGPGLDGKSVVYDYTVGQCPAVIGCLWIVTDGEIDRFFMSMVEFCFKSDKNTTVNDGQRRLRSLLEAMRKARSLSKLPYLTGAAVVNYGLSVTACE